MNVVKMSSEDYEGFTEDIENLTSSIETLITSIASIKGLGGNEVEVKKVSKAVENKDIWKHILNKLNYKDEDEIIVTSEDIKSAKSSWKGKESQFEPRLAAYQPFEEGRSEYLREKNLYILPIKNGCYLISKTKIYKSLEYNNSIETVNIIKDSSSLILNIGNSESSLIDNLHYSKVFERVEFLNEPITHGSLLNGRHRCNFVTKLNNKKVTIESVQYEVDACYESKNKILIIEAKSLDKQITNFNIRQLYYPFREIYNKIQGKKEILCLFILQIKAKIHIWKYTFDDIDNMLSINCKGYYKYIFSSESTPHSS